jgi:hypothetical protein
MNMKTIDIRFLVPDDVAPEVLTGRLIGRIPFDTVMLGEVYGAVELLHADSCDLVMPGPQVYVRQDIVWDGEAQPQ